MILVRILLSAKILFALMAAVGAQSAFAQNEDGPHWRSLRFDEVNMRVGPSREYKIDWVYQRKGLPVQVIRRREGWLLIRDFEGTQGWVADSQTTRRRAALVVGEGLADLREEPSAASALRWRAEPGVVAELRLCREDYCEINIEGRTGWVAQERLWGNGDVEPKAPGPSIETVPLP